MPPIICTSKIRWSDSRRRAFELLAVLQPLPELGRLPEQLAVGELGEVRLERGNEGRLLDEALHAPPFAEAKCLLEGA